MSIRLEIGPRITYDLPNRVYKFRIEFMHGDCDGTTYQEVLVSEDSPYLIRFVEFLESAVNLYPHGRDYRDDYKKAEHSWLFCGWERRVRENPDNLPEEEIKTRIQEFLNNDVPFKFEGDITLQGEGKASLETYEVVYIDEDCLPHSVQVITE